MDRAYFFERLKNLLAIDSPTGWTREIADYLIGELKGLGLPAHRNNKGSVLSALTCQAPAQEPLMLAVHLDTLGLMVEGVEENGRLRVAPIGALRAESCEGENLRVYTRDGRVWGGVLLPKNASLHVNLEIDRQKPEFPNMEVLLDEDPRRAEEVRALGVENGDFIALEPRTVITGSGTIKSRFLDDKLCVAILLAYLKEVRDRGAALKRKIYLHFSVQEEVGYGASSPLPQDLAEFLSLDLGCVGDGLRGSERKVSICAKDLLGPYDSEVIAGLEAAAMAAGADFAVDLYPYYTSDSDAVLISGLDAKHGLMGPGVYASHAYERAHIDGAENAFKLLWEYTVARS